MAFLGLKKNKKEAPKDKPEKGEKKAKAPAKVKAVRASGEVSPRGIILKPRITEKASLVSESNTYTFDVARNAGKKEIAQEVRALYKVTPLRVRVAQVPAKKMFVRGKLGSTRAGKKAYVTLKEGDKIELA